MNLVGKKTLVVGLGKSGMAAARFLKKQGAAVTVTDRASEADLADVLGEIDASDIRMELGGHKITTFETADLIVISPGVPHTIPPVRAAVKKGVPLWGEIELASRFINEPIAAITGTNGKTTATTLLGDMLTASGKKVFVGGNIGNPLIDYVDAEEAADIVVAEISSFQMDTAISFHPHVGVLLNITEDHLDRYPDFTAYVKSKMRMFALQKQGNTAVFNSDLPDLTDLTGSADFSEMSASLKNRKLIFSTAPLSGFHHGKIEGAVIETDQHGAAVISVHMREYPDAVIDLSGFKPVGKHNQENAAAAALAALAAGGTPAGIQQAVNQFKGLPHRLEHIASFNKIRYYNDSKATNPDAAATALAAFPDPVILIMGGRNKGYDFSMLKKVVSSRVKHLIVMGEAKNEIMDTLKEDCRGKTHAADSMETAVQKASALAAAGDTVLLSPACASFDMYSGYAARGDDFSNMVHLLIKKAAS